MLNAAFSIPQFLQFIRKADTIILHFAFRMMHYAVKDR